MSKQPGDPIQIGDLLGHPMEPWDREGRVTGFIKKVCREDGSIETLDHPYIIFRKFADDSEPFPTGEYRRTRLCVPLMTESERVRA